MPPTLLSVGLFPNEFELDPEYARPTFCCPCGVLGFQFHPNGKPSRLPGVGFVLKLPLGNGEKPPLPGRKIPNEPSVNCALAFWF